MRTILVAITVLTISGLSSSSLFAQTGLGGTGTSGLGTSTSGLSGMGTSGLTGTTFGTTGTTTGITGTTNRTSTGTTGTTGTTGNTGTTGQAAGNGQTGTSNTATQNFVGGNAAQNFVGGSRQATNQQGTNRQFQAFQNTQQGMNQGMSTTGTPRQVRTALRIGFSFPNATSAQASGNLAAANQANLSRYVITRPEFTGINVNMTPEGVAVLTGSTDSVEASRLAANLLRLQPGVRGVDNQLAVNR